MIHVVDIKRNEYWLNTEHIVSVCDDQEYERTKIGLVNGGVIYTKKCDAVDVLSAMDLVVDRNAGLMIARQSS